MDTADGDVTILQDDQVHNRGELIGAVVADTAETVQDGMTQTFSDEQVARKPLS